MRKGQLGTEEGSSLHRDRGCVPSRAALSRARVTVSAGGPCFPLSRPLTFQPRLGISHFIHLRCWKNRAQLLVPSPGPPPPTPAMSSPTSALEKGLVAWKAPLPPLLLLLLPLSGEQGVGGPSQGEEEDRRGWDCGGQKGCQASGSGPGGWRWAWP